MGKLITSEERKAGENMRGRRTYRERLAREIAHDLAYELWAADSDAAVSLRTHGEIVSGYCMTSELGWGNGDGGLFSVVVMAYRTDDEGCNEWERVRAGQHPDWTRRERLGPDVSIPMADSIYRRGDRTRVLLIAGAVAAGALLLFRVWSDFT